ncbi:MAG: CDP-alcohol phosphatidyltransferase family protein [Candidatus Aminicenantes bacterium]|nr:CDP-alcohol phosphatidyltransferase family protein [Candidatus Aminicenantes bacterium]
MKIAQDVSSLPKKGFRLLPEKVAQFVLSVVNNLSLSLARQKANPNILSAIGLILGAVAGLFFALGQPLLAAFFVLLCGFFDILDGKVAENSGRRSLFGAIFDSSLDRYSEFFIYLGLAYYFRHHWSLWLIFFTILGSFMVSYARARAEGLGMRSHIGLMQRAERMILLIVGAIAGVIFDKLTISMVVVLLMITVASHITAWQRIFFVRQWEKAKSQSKEV